MLQEHTEDRRSDERYDFSRGIISSRQEQVIKADKQPDRTEMHLTGGSVNTEKVPALVG